MAEAAVTGEAGLIAEEARLARAAAAGDGDAFATLYERYARRAYNLAHRLSGSEDDAADAVQEAFLSVMRRLPELEGRELAFGSYLFTATRNATYDLMRRQQRSRPSDSIPESAVPVGAGAGGLGLDPGDPDEDPDRKVLLEAQQEEIREANARLPERQREALALRELEDLSYDEIAEVMEMNRNSVAQLISRARVNLRDELRGTALASIAASSPDCERALPLIAAREDAQLDPELGDAAWLGSHLAGCETCRVARQAMQEAGASYRLWVPLAVAPWVFRETMARAAELVGEDWSEVAERRAESPADAAAIPGLPAAYREARADAAGRGRRTVFAGTFAAALLAVVIALGLSAGLDDSNRPLEEPVAEEPLERPRAEAAPEPSVKRDRSPAPVEAAEPEPAPTTEAAPSPTPSTTETRSEPEPPSAGPGGGSGAIRTTKPVTEPEPEPTAEPEPESEAPPPSEPPPEREPETPSSGPPIPGGPKP